MKTKTAKLISIVFFLSAATVVSVSGQVHNRLIVNVPFDFYIGDQKLDAGEYVVESMNKSADGTALRFAKNDGTRTVLVKLSPMEIDWRQNSTAMITFNRYGAAYYLTAIKNPGETFGARAIRSRQEREVAQQTNALAANVGLARRTN